MEAYLDRPGELQLESYNPKERVTEALKVLFNLRPWQTITTQKLSEKLYLSVPTMLKVMKECEEWLSYYNIKLVNERSRGYRLLSRENEYRIALRNLMMERSTSATINQNLDYFFRTLMYQQCENVSYRQKTNGIIDLQMNHFMKFLFTVV